MRFSFLFLLVSFNLFSAPFYMKVTESDLSVGCLGRKETTFDLGEGDFDACIFEHIQEQDLRDGISLTFSQEEHGFGDFQKNIEALMTHEEARVFLPHVTKLSIYGNKSDHAGSLRFLNTFFSQKKELPGELEAPYEKRSYGNMPWFQDPARVMPALESLSIVDGLLDGEMAQGVARLLRGAEADGLKICFFGCEQGVPRAFFDQILENGLAPKVHALEISGCELGCRHLKKEAPLFQVVERAHSLKALNISGLFHLPRGGADALSKTALQEFVELLSSVGSLKELSLCEIGFCESEVSALSELFKVKQFEKIDLSYNALRGDRGDVPYDFSQILLGGLAAQTGLKKLDLTNTGIPYGSYKHLLKQERSVSAASSVSLKSWSPKQWRKQYKRKGK